MLHVPENFINREREIELVLRMVSELANGKPFAPQERVFHFVGPSGIGKSRLLKEFCLKLRAEHTNCIFSLVQLDTLDGGARGLVDGLLVKVYESFCGYKNVTPKNCDRQKQKTIASYVHQAIEMFEDDQIIAMLLDEVDIPSQKDMKEVEELLLLSFLNANSRAVLITAGRSHSKWTNYMLVSKPSNTFHVYAFDEKQTGEQIESLKPGSKGLAGKVQNLGSGVPGNTVKLVDHVVGTPPDIPDEALAVRSLLDNIKSTNAIPERSIPMLEALSILQGFFPEDAAPLFQVHPQLGAGWDERRVKAEFQQLKEIKVGPGGIVDWDREKKHWAMDERTRDLFERELQMRNPPDLWRKLHCTAMKMYRDWGNRYNSDAYRKKSEYHQNCLQSAGLVCTDLEG